MYDVKDLHDMNGTEKDGGTEKDRGRTSHDFFTFLHMPWPKKTYEMAFRSLIRKILSTAVVNEEESTSNGDFQSIII